jgi:hypothetical protein
MAYGLFQSYLTRDETGFWADRHASSSKDSADTISAESANAEKRMEDSYVEVDLPFESEPALLEQYIGAFTSVRIGRIMEGMIFIFHSLLNKSDALLDRLG